MTAQLNLSDDQYFKMGQTKAKRSARGPYRSYDIEIKRKVLELHKNEGMSYTQISKVLGIPSKNIIRWCQQGVERKMGAGRKILDPTMEEKLYKWISQNYLPGSEI